ncbi:MAG: thiosulfohydrolase SoxB, partial [Burkholderiales bacterium]
DMGSRINNMMLKGKPIEADKKYKVAGWASVQEGVQGEPIWDVVSGYLRNKKVIKGVKINTPQIVGMGGNPGISI